MVFFVFDLAKLRIRNEVCNIVILKCLGPIVYGRVMIVTPKPITKLGFGLGIMP